MKTLLKKIGVDLILVLLCVFLFWEKSFIFVGMGIIYLGVVLYQYLNYK